MNEEILKLVKEKGLLLEKDIFDLLNSFKDINLAKDFLDSLEKFSSQKIITKSVLNKNFEHVQSVVNRLPGESKATIEKIFVKLGLSLEIRKESGILNLNKSLEKPKLRQDYQIFSPDTKTNKKIEVSDFVGNFRSRYQELQRILMNRRELQQNLISINKISGDRQSINIIAIVTEKRTTKNKNLIIKFEDLTGQINGLIKVDKEELFAKASELQLDDVVGIKASGNRDILFVYDIFFPDAFISEKVKFDNEFSIAFLSDLHCGSQRHLQKSMEKFLNWINSSDSDAKKIKYIFFVGDNVDGVGIYPGQENLLILKSMKEQYCLLASYLKRIPKHITMFMCPGQHDAVRVAEPQPIIDRRYAPDLYEIDNLVLVSNPTTVKLMEGNKEFRVLMYHGASIHTFITEIKELVDLKAHKSPAKAVKHMLKRRHLAPTHSAETYIPNSEKDPMVISEVPDLLCTGEVHRLDVENYNGVLIITGSCWQTQTPLEEKIGNIPDQARVPVYNLKTRELKVFEFSEEEKHER